MDVDDVQQHGHILVDAPPVFQTDVYLQEEWISQENASGTPISLPATPPSVNPNSELQLKDKRIKELERQVKGLVDNNANLRNQIRQEYAQPSQDTPYLLRHFEDYAKRIHSQDLSLHFFFDGNRYH